MDRSVYLLHHPVLLLQKMLVSLQVDEGLGVQPHPALLVPLVVDVEPVLQLGAGFGGACGAGRFKVDGVQAFLGEAGVLGQRGEQLLHHSAGGPSRLRAQGQRAAVGWGVAALVAVICGGGGLPHRGAAVRGGAQRVAADAVLPGTEAAAGHRGGGGFAHRAAGALQAAGRHRVHTHQRGRELAVVVRQVHIYGCCRDDTRWVWDPHVCRNST